MWRRLRRFAEAGILGMNRRNVSYIAAENPRSHFVRVDDKLRTKVLAERANLAVPELYGVVRHHFEVRALPELVGDREDFVLKPARGSAGKGILVVAGREGDGFVLANGRRVGWDALRRHAANILSGLYSLGGREDVVMVEARVRFSDLFEPYTHGGVPDVRVVVFRGYPVMAMARLATRASDGRANLHQGAVGLGLDVASGHATNAVWRGRPTRVHPDSGRELRDLRIPQWRDVLELAAACYEMTGLGYLGVDVVFDRVEGPQMIELNARPGLSIQVANREGLADRLEAVERLSEPDPDPASRSAFAVRHFGR